MAAEQNIQSEKWYWPTIVDLPSAIAASNKGVWAAGCVAVLTGLIALASILLPEKLAGLTLWSMLDAVVFGGIAIGIYRRSRICAVAALVLFILEKILQLAESGLGILGIGIAGFFIVLFLIGIKGTFAFHKLRIYS